MARRRSRLSRVLPTVSKIIVAYELGAYAWNWYQQYSNQTTGGTLLPLDGIGALIGYPGAGTGSEGLLQTEL